MNPFAQFQDKPMNERSNGMDCRDHAAFSQ
jgi:hypothetical protein